MSLCLWRISRTDPPSSFCNSNCARHRIQKFVRVKDTTALPAPVPTAIVTINRLGDCEVVGVGHLTWRARAPSPQRRARPPPPSPPGWPRCPIQGAASSSSWASSWSLSAAQSTHEEMLLIFLKITLGVETSSESDERGGNRHCLGAWWLVVVTHGFLLDAACREQGTRSSANNGKLRKLCCCVRRAHSPQQSGPTRKIDPIVACTGIDRDKVANWYMSKITLSCSRRPGCGLKGTAPSKVVVHCANQRFEYLAP